VIGEVETTNGIATKTIETVLKRNSVVDRSITITITMTGVTMIIDRNSRKIMIILLDKKGQFL